MIRFIHTSDLHLKLSEKDYCLSVLREVVEKGNQKNCHFMLICGDIFDRFTDIDPLKREAIEILDSFHGEIFAIQGNHEELSCPPSTDPYSANIGKMKIASNQQKKVFPYINKESGLSVEIEAIPFHKQFPYEQIQKTKPDSAKLRIAMAHGSEPSLVEYLGPSKEETNSILEFHPFKEAGFHYLALGHIHSSSEKRNGDFLYSYSGSPRIVRSGEFGAKTINYLEWSPTTGLQLEKLEIEAAGQYREIPVSLSLTGEASLSQTERAKIGRKDSVRLVLKGVCENENSVLESFEALKSTIQCREIEIERGKVTIIAQLVSNPMARLFLEKVEAKRIALPNEEIDWNEVIQVGLSALGGKK